MKEKMKKMSLFLLLAGIMLCGCGNQTEKETETEKETVKENVLDKVEAPSGEGVQFEDAENYSTLAEMEIEGYGTITFCLFEEQAPKAVENFVKLSESGYYEGVTFHRVINDFMIQGGDPTGTGSGGESAFGADFEDEFSMDLFPYRGSLCMANAGSNTNGSQFFIVQSDQKDASFTEQIRELGADQVADNYEKIGGTPWLWYKHTVFGQVLDGMEVVDAIAAVETNAQDKPLEDVVIKKITIIHQ